MRPGRTPRPEGFQKLLGPQERLLLDQRQNGRLSSRLARAIAARGLSAFSPSSATHFGHALR